MKQIIVLFLLLIFSVGVAWSQTPGDTISYNKVFGGYKFEYNGKLLTPKSMLTLMENDSVAYNLMWQAKSSYNLAMVIGAVGGALIGYPIGTAMGGGEPVWAMAGVGAGLVMLSIPISMAYNRKALGAVRIFNGNKSGLSAIRDTGLYFGLNHRGIGFRLQF